MAASDTAFVEARRYEQRGVRSADGRCRWGPVHLPPRDSILGWSEDRDVSLDHKTCVRIGAVGYRKVRP